MGVDRSIDRSIATASLLVYLSTVSIYLYLYIDLVSGRRSSVAFRGRSSTWRIYARARAAYIRGRDSGADAFSTPSRRGGCVVYIYRRISSASRARRRRRARRRSRGRSSSMGGLMMIDFRARKSSRHASARAYDRARRTSRARVWARFGWRENSVVAWRGRSRSWRGRGRARASDATATHRQRPDATAGAFSWVPFENPRVRGMGLLRLLMGVRFYICRVGGLYMYMWMCD